MPRPVYLTKGQEPRDLAGVVDESFEHFFISFSAAVGAFVDVNEMERDKVGDRGRDGEERGRLKTEDEGEVCGERHKSNWNSERTSNMDVSTRTDSDSSDTPRTVWSSLSSTLGVMIAVTPKAATTAFVSVS